MNGHRFSIALCLAAALCMSLPAATLAAAEKEEGEEEAAPQLKFLELHGYYRVRSDLFYGLDLGTYNFITGQYSSRVLPPITGRVGGTPTQMPKSEPMSGGTLAGANMRFRLEPTLNISDEIRIIAQIDMLDNLVLGSTPEAYTGVSLNPYYPLPAFSQTQTAPHRGNNSYTDSITLKRAWGEVTTPFGQLRFGRMPSHWGLGILVNDGNCFDCDGGANADRIMFITRVLNHYIIPAIDFQSEGVTTKGTGYPQEFYYQPIDAEQRDDVQQYVLAVARRDKPEEIKEALENNKTVLNYGLYNVLRLQSYDFPDYYQTGNAPDRAQNLVRRDVKLYIGSPWFKLMWRKLHIEFEVDFIAGEIGDATNKNADVFPNDAPGAAAEADALDLSIFQWGGVLQADYKFLRDKLKVGVEAGMASGDDAPGWGLNPIAKPVYDLEDGTKTRGYALDPFGPRQFGDYYRADGSLVKDRNITNFRFNPDYRIDMILWREVIGQFTDAWYVKPSIQYLIAEGFGVGMDLVYSQAMFAESAPGQEAPLGLEFDFHIFYLSEDGFAAGLDYGVLVPFSGMDNLGMNHVRSDADLDVNMDLGAETAQRLRGYLGIKF